MLGGPETRPKTAKSFEFGTLGNAGDTAGVSAASEDRRDIKEGNDWDWVTLHRGEEAGRGRKSGRPYSRPAGGPC